MRSKTKKHLQHKYRQEYYFPRGKYMVTIERMMRKPGTQVNLLDMISECEQQQDQL